MGPILQKTIDAANLFAQELKKSSKFELYIEPETNIVTYFPKAKSTSEISILSEEIMQKLMQDKKLWIARLKVSSNLFAKNHPSINVDSDSVLILRSCLMKPEHFHWTSEIMKILESVL